MKSPIIRIALVILSLGFAVAVGILLIFPMPELPEARSSDQVAHSADPVPWREPEADIRRYFPGADGHREESRILSRERLTLIRRLGRQPLAEEYLAVLHRVLRGKRRVGVVMVRRVAGAGGSIEVVTAVSSAGKVQGLRLQRHREPVEVSRVLEAPAWLGRFTGKTAASDWSSASSVPEPAKSSAAAIVEAVRSNLILLEIAEAKGIPAASDAHH